MTANDNTTQKPSFFCSQRNLEKRTYSVQEIAGILQVSRSKAYQLCDGKNFRVLKLVRLIRISKVSFDK